MPWRKVLYDRQPYEDNYVDASFLDSLILNANVQRYEYASMCLQASAVAQQISIVVCFLCVSSRAQRGVWGCDELLRLDATLLAAGYALRVACRRMEACGTAAAAADVAANAARDIWRGVLMAAPLWVLAPTLRTLTRSWSDDTIVSLTIGLLMVHTLLHDYGGTSRMAGGAGALNAAMLAATIAASRLESDDEVFAFIALAIELFAFLPWLSWQLRRAAPRAHAILLTPLLAASAVALLGLGWTAVAFLAVLTVVGLLAPAVLLWLQRYKFEIQGPWDIAHVAPAPASDPYDVAHAAEACAAYATASAPAPGDAKAEAYLRSGPRTYC